MKRRQFAYLLRLHAQKLLSDQADSSSERGKGDRSRIACGRNQLLQLRRRIRSPSRLDASSVKACSSHWHFPSPVAYGAGGVFEDVAPKSSSRENH